MAFSLGRIPPWRKTEEEKEEKRLFEFIPAERPSPLPESIVLEAPEELEEAVEAYVSGMSEYATQHDVFVSDEKKALNEKKVELVGLSKELAQTENPSEKKRIESAMVSAITEINGELSKNVQKEIYETLKFKSSYDKFDAPVKVGEIDSTQKETGQHLEDTIRAVVAENPKQSIEEMQEQNAKERYSEQMLDRTFAREQKAQAFAEKFGLTEARESLQNAEDAYKTALTNKRLTVWPLKDKAVIEAQKEYDAARLSWRTALGSMTESADKNDKIMARFIGLRDTAVRPEVLRQEAARELLDKKAGSVGTKVLGWTKRIAFGGLGAIQKSTEWVGGKVASAQGFAYETFSDKKFDQEKWTRRHARAVRIVGGAAIATAITGGWAGLGVPLILRIVRGGASTIAGAGAGGVTGRIYERTVNAGRQKELLSTLKDVEGAAGLSDAEALKTEEEIYARGNAAARAKGRQRVEMGATVLVAGASSLTSNMIANHYTHLESFQKAANTLSESSAPSPIPSHTPGIAPSSPEAISVNSTPAAPPNSISMVAGATIEHRGEGTGVLFENLKTAIRENGAFAKNPSAGLKHFLETNVNDMSREMGKAFDGNGMRVHMGDQFYVDENQNVYFQPKGGAAQLFIEHSGKVHELNPPGGMPTETPKAEVQPERTVTPRTTPTPVSTVAPEAAIPPSAAPAPTADSGLNSQIPAPANDNLAPQTETVPAPAPTPTPDSVPETPARPTVSPEYIPKPAPAPETIPSTAAPIESAPSVPSASAESIITTTRGLSLDTSAPAAYSYELPGGKNVMVMFGGSTDDRYIAAQQYLISHPGATVRFETTVDSLVTGKPQPTIFEWSSDQKGAIQYDIAAPEPGTELPPIDPNKITKKLNFNYVKQ